MRRRRQRTKHVSPRLPSETKVAEVDDKARTMSPNWRATSGLMIRACRLASSTCTAYLAATRDSAPQAMMMRMLASASLATADDFDSDYNEEQAWSAFGSNMTQDDGPARPAWHKGSHFPYTPRRAKVPLPLRRGPDT